MKIPYLNMILSANILVFAVLAVQMPHLMVAPGTLIEGHEDLAEDCFACHDGFGSSSEKCISCHTPEEIGIKTTKGRFIKKDKKKTAFHQKLKEKDCMECHSDHAGISAFRGGPSRFSHRLLDEKDIEKCTSCHKNPKDSLHSKIQGNCAECHNTRSWESAKFDHDEYFRFDRDHNVKCSRCHENNNYKQYTCYGCHEHTRSNIRNEHIEEGIRDFENCTECHRSPDEDEAEHTFRSKFRGKKDKSHRREREDDDD